jgi:hypothetical protein
MPLKQFVIVTILCYPRCSPFVKEYDLLLMAITGESGTAYRSEVHPGF